MVGFIITGHGKFASGILTAVNLIVGNPENITSVDFLENDTTETLKKKLLEASEKMDVDGYIFFCDILGGSPFKMAAELMRELKNVEVLAGTNLAMIIENIFSRDTGNVKKLANACIETGRNALGKFDFGGQLKNKKKVEGI